MKQRGNQGEAIAFKLRAIKTHLLALDAADAEFAAVAVGRLGRGALGGLLLLQVLKCARQSERGAVEVARAQRKGQHELVVEDQRSAPCRQIRTADCQHILCRKLS